MKYKGLRNRTVKVDNSEFVRIRESYIYSRDDLSELSDKGVETLVERDILEEVEDEESAGGGTVQEIMSEEIEEEKEKVKEEEGE